MLIAYELKTKFLETFRKLRKWKTKKMNQNLENDKRKTSSGGGWMAAFLLYVLCTAAQS
jgi:hypothetical protein